ncbi:MAG: motility protein A [Candidatus Muiribacterium halophilum]|uniref:Motility protein A n=1 Tax=Muiribacterium halophilum TaxID=2053465 RepID=A0A2N5ZI94_MUIH1|nr:MAG: motility protein A [Candidatus Muirbacterium halophilum]
MDKSTIIGIILGSVLVASGIGVEIAAFIDVPSMLIVFGGSLGGVFISFSMEQMKDMPNVLKKAFHEEVHNPLDTISSLVSFAEKARREGLLALEDDVEKVDDTFFKKCIQLVVDGTDPDLVRRILETEIEYLETRHSTGKAMVDKMGELAPAFGMIGTLIGLIKMLGKLDDPNALGPGMAVALITTFYGAVIANLFCIPLSSKLGAKSAEEILIKYIMLEGLLSIQAGDNPRIVEEKLKAFLPPAMRQGASSESSEEEAGEEEE